MAFASLTIDLNARLANIERDLGKSVHMAEKSAQKMQAAFAGVGKAFALLGGAGALLGFGNWIKQSIAAADALTDLNVRTGLSIETLAGLQWAAHIGDVSMEQLAKGVGKLNLALGQAQTGNLDISETLERLGITARDPEQALVQLAEAVERMPDPTQRAVELNKLLGRSYQDLLPLLSEGGAGLQALLEKGRELNPITTEMAEAAAKFTDALDEMKAQASGAGITIANVLLPTMNGILERFNNAVTLSSRHGGFVGLILRGVNPTGDNARELRNVRAQIEGMERMRDAMDRDPDDLSALNARIDALKAIRVTLQEIEREEALAFGKPFADYKQAAPPSNAIEFGDLIDEDEARRLQSTLTKAFDIKPLDDFLGNFRTRRQSIETEYAQLIAKLTGPSIAGATGLDLSSEITRGRGAFAGGDSTGTQVAVDRAKQMLEGLKDNGGADFEVRYYGEQVKQLEIALLDAQQSTAETARNALLDNLNAAAAEVEKMEPLHIPIASEAIAQDLRKTLDVIRQELAANPLQVPVVASNAGGVYAESNLARAALKFGGR